MVDMVVMAEVAMVAMGGHFMGITETTTMVEEAVDVVIVADVAAVTESNSTL